MENKNKHAKPYNKQVIDEHTIDTLAIENKSAIK